MCKMYLDMNLIIIWCIAQVICFVAAEKTANYNIKRKTFLRSAECKKGKFFLKCIRKFIYQPTCTEPLNLTIENDINLWSELQYRCNGKIKCEMNDFKQRELQLHCKEKVHNTSNFDIHFECKPNDEDIIHDITEKKSDISKTKNVVHYLIHNFTSEYFKHYHCLIHGAKTDNFTVTLLYIGWDRMSRDKNKEEYVIIQSTKYEFNTITPVAITVNSTKSIKIDIYKRSSFVWMEFTVNTPKTILCRLEATRNNSLKKEKDSINDIFLFIVIPPCSLVAIIITLILLYHYGLICKCKIKINDNVLIKNESIQNDGNDYSTINESNRQTRHKPKVTEVYNEIETKHASYQCLEENTKKYESEEYKITRPDDTYAVVNKVPRTSKANVEFQISSASVHHCNTSDEINTDYAHLAHMQDMMKQTENVYNG